MLFLGNVLPCHGYTKRQIRILLLEIQNFLFQPAELRLVAVYFLLALGDAPVVVAKHNLCSHTSEVFDLTVCAANSVGVMMCAKAAAACHSEN